MGRAATTARREPCRIGVSRLPAGRDSIEIVERKGKGHPDTMADAMSEAFSRALCNFYIEQSGAVLHHNVDKLLIAAGSARPAFGGGEITAPFDVFLAGRAAGRAGGVSVPVERIADAVVTDWIGANLHAVDAREHARVHCVVRPGAGELVDLFLRGKDRPVPLANDTSIGAAYAPLSATERLVLAAERHLTSAPSIAAHPERGEDVKIMAVRNGGTVRLTVACALIGRFLGGMADYAGAKRAIVDDIRRLPEAGEVGDLSIAVNAADDMDAGSVYLTVTGTSAEAGDDGQTGRGNRINGLIVPLKPTSLEAAAGKNPVSHVGKLYNVAAQRICDSICAEIEEVEGVQCAMLSQIGQPIDRPAMVQVRLTLRRGQRLGSLRRPIRDIVARHLGAITSLTAEFAAGTVAVF